MSNKTITSLKDFDFVSKLGEGAFAEVFKVKRKEDGLYYAMKKIRLARIKEKDRNNALNEIRILASDSGDNVIQYKQAFYDEPSTTLCIVMQYAEGGDLLKLIQSHAKKHTKIKQKQIWKAMVHISRGLKSLHEKKILHRDLKGANIFITADGQYKIGDLNVSKVIKYDSAKTQTGTPYYASPEVWKDMPYGTKSDMWSLGCVLYEMAAQKPPFTAPDIQSLYKKICNGGFIRIPPDYSNDLATVISSLLKTNANDRPSAGNLLNNPLVENNYTDQKIFKDTWQKDELLQTIRLTSKNYKEINDILPKAKYRDDRRMSRQGSFSQERRISYHTPNKQEKDLIKQVQKKRVNSTFEQNRINISSKREKTNSSCNPSKVITQIVNQQIKELDLYPLSHKIIKKLPSEVSNLVKNTPKIQNSAKNSQVSRLPPCPSTKTSRKRVQSLFNQPSLIESSQGNKQNLRRAGENIIGRVNTSKSISEY